MFAYSIYKNHKEKQQAHSSAGYERKLSTDSDTTPLGIDMDAKPLGRQGTFSDVVDKKQARKQWIALAISLFIDVVLPLVLYVSVMQVLDRVRSYSLSKNLIHTFLVCYQRPPPYTDGIVDFQYSTGY
jgi:hypothetical protein